jgi:hypothetical protein
MARRRKEERRAGSASRGMVRRWSHFSSRVRHRCSLTVLGCLSGATPRGSAVDVYSDAPAWAPRTERVANGGVVDVSRALLCVVKGIANYGAARCSI